MAGKLDELLFILGREPDARVRFHGLEAPQLDLALLFMVCGLLVMRSPVGGGVEWCVVVAKDGGVQVDPVDELLG